MIHFRSERTWQKLPFKKIPKRAHFQKHNPTDTCSTAFFFQDLKLHGLKKNKNKSIFKQQMLGLFKAALLGIIKINGLNRVTIDRNHVYAAAWSD